MTYGFVDDRLTPEFIAKALGGAVPMTRDQVGVRLRILGGPTVDLDARDRAVRCDRRAFVATILDLYRQLDAIEARDAIAPAPECDCPSEAEHGYGCAGLLPPSPTPYPAPSYPDLTLGC